MERLHQRDCGQRKKLAQAARLWARGQLNTTGSKPHESRAEVDTALAIFGLVQDPNDTPVVREQFFYLWPCNLRTFNAWLQVQTQWRYSAVTGKRTGLCYAGVQAWLSSQPGLRPRVRAEVMRGLQAMEIAAINVWADQA